MKPAFRFNFAAVRRLCCAAAVALSISLGAHTSLAQGVVPETDPAPEGKVPEMVPALRGKHPRLLLNAATLPKLRAFYNSPDGEPWRKKIEAYNAASQPPKAGEVKFLTDATDAQRQGLWKLPTTALHYLMTGDEKSLANAKGFLELFLSLPNWETGGERDSGMGAANIMIGAALAYDWIYDKLDPDFRSKFRDKLLYHARAMYHGGHLKKNTEAKHYWQNDPANNHRWHRNAGLTLSILAIYENKPEEQWILQQAIKDLEFVKEWLPHDGTCHEGPLYLTFGGNHLTLAFDAADQCLGTDLMQAPYFKATGVHRTHVLRPGLKDVLPFGDCGSGSVGGYNNFFLKAASLNQQADVKDALMRMLEKDPKSFEFGWFSLLWDDPALKRGNIEKLPTSSFSPDIGFATMRESWGDDAVAAAFKCGPFGGYDLNRYAAGKNYINVAHDDPDANMFLIAMGDELVAANDGYSKRKSSRNHNTILINGTGQMSKGRPDGGEWSQPAVGGADMTKMGVVTSYRDNGAVVAVEGEASGSYLPLKGKRPGLDRFRRTMVWVKGGYILLIDDIRAPSEVDVDWLVQGKALDAADEKEGRFVLKSGAKECSFQIVADKPLTFAIQDSPADHRAKPMGLKQLKANSKTQTLRVASVFNPWTKKNLSVSLAPGASPDEATIRVDGEGIADTWQWKAGPGQFGAGTISGTRTSGDKAGFPFRMDASNIPPK
ncbi:hypothetical protein DB346_14905 [Verrucomicrobia bacterium LW23]|nr:hypothetical protein DB346_14905 [Verrucomicrobia bacterium LW23]